MPEEIRPGREVSRGFISTNRAGQSGLSALADALETTTNFAENQVERKRREELTLVQDQLSNPLLTEAEINEIESNALFPLAQLKAKNRKGELFAQRAYDTALDLASDAPDAPAARQILREAQQGVLEEFGEDAGVAAGIRERFASFSPKILEAASQRRVALRAQEEAAALSETMRSSLETGPLFFMDGLIGQVEEEALAGGDVNAVYEMARLSIASFYDSGDDKALGAGNVNTRKAFEAIDLILKNSTLDAKQRKEFTGLRQRIEGIEEQGLTSPASIAKETNKRVHAANVGAITRFNAANPNQAIPDALAAAALASGEAVSAAENRATLALIKGIVPKVGVRDTDTWKEQRAILKSTFGKVGPDGSYIFDSAMKPALDAFDAIGRALPSNLRDDPEELQRIAAQFGNEAVTKGQQIFNERATAASNFEKEAMDETQKHIELAKSPGATPEDKEFSKSALREHFRKKREHLIQVHNNLLDEWAIQNGIDIRTDVVNTLTER